MVHSADTPAVLRPTEPEEMEPSDLRLAVKPRILLIEDNALIAEMMESALMDEGFRVIGIAETAERAVKLARLYRPDLAITDIRLSGQDDGIQAALQIFNETGARSIFATGNLDKVAAGRCAHAQPLGWLTKPFTPSQLVEAVQQAMGSVEIDA